MHNHSTEHAVSFCKAQMRSAIIDCFLLYNGTLLPSECFRLYWCTPCSLIKNVVLLFSQHDIENGSAAFATGIVHQQSTIQQDTTHFIDSRLLTISTWYIQRLWYTVMIVSVTETRLKGMNRLGGSAKRGK